jgi:hypothetical protein
MRAALGPWLLASLVALASAPATAAEPLAQSTLQMHLSVLSPRGGGAGAQAALNLGTVSAVGSGRKKPAIVLRERVAVRLDGKATTARLSVALAQDLPGSTVRVNGQTISMVPRLIHPAHPVGTTVVHQLEITIADDVPAGAFLNNLQWVAETD